MFPNEETRPRTHIIAKPRPMTFFNVKNQGQYLTLVTLSDIWSSFQLLESSPGPRINVTGFM